MNDQALNDLECFIDALGLAFQIRDDILDVEGSTAQIGKQAGADAAKRKATYPALFGLEFARERADDLLARALTAIERFGREANILRAVAEYVVRREA
jgi:geranylgeranyl diphosphate synthase type II